jgi:hypothetical protein
MDGITSKDILSDDDSQKNLYLIFLGLLSVSFVGYPIFRSTSLGLVFGHTGGLSIMVFYGGLVGTIAKRKGYKYFNGFKVGFLIPIILGIIAAFLLVPSQSHLPLTCGGWVALSSGLLIVIIFLFIKKKKTS